MSVVVRKKREGEWNAETIARLRASWAEGLSAAVIGERLGISKNSVVGKAHRLDLPARPSPIIRRAADEATVKFSDTRQPFPAMHPVTWGALQGAVLLDSLERVKGNGEKIRTLLAEAERPAIAYVWHKMGLSKPRRANLHLVAGPRRAETTPAA